MTCSFHNWRPISPSPLHPCCRKGKEIRTIHTGKEVKLSLFADSMKVHIENPEKN